MNNQMKVENQISNDLANIFTQLTSVASKFYEMDRPNGTIVVPETLSNILYNMSSVVNTMRVLADQAAKGDYSATTKIAKISCEMGHLVHEDIPQYCELCGQYMDDPKSAGHLEEHGIIVGEY